LNGTTIADDTWDLGVGGSAPQFSQQPSSIAANPGDQVSFQTQANGVSGWQWTKDNVPLSNGGRISGANSASLTITGITSVDWGSYRAVASNNCGNTPSNPAVLSQSSHCGSSDFNCDNAVGTDADIETFFSCLSGTCPPPPCTSSADFNGDGAVGTDADIEAFFRVLAGGPC
jgi:hypothetical protein